MMRCSTRKPAISCGDCAVCDRNRVNRPGRLSDQANGDATDVSWLAWVDVSTGRFYAAAFPAEQVADQLARIQPAELLISDDSQPLLAELDQRRSRSRGGPPGRSAARPRSKRSPNISARSRSKVSVSTRDGRRRLGRAAGRRRGAQLSGRNTKGVARAHRSTSFRTRPSERLAIDPATRRSLELVATMRDGQREGSLLGTLDRTVTCLGARLLADWLAAPLTDVAAINARLDAVAELVTNATVANQLRETLRQIYDIQRLLARVTTGRASPRDLGLRRPHARLLAEGQSETHRPHERSCCSEIEAAARSVRRRPRAARTGARRRLPAHVARRRLHPRRLPRRPRRAARADGRRQAMDGRVSGRRMPADRHREHEGRLQLRCSAITWKSRTRIAKRCRPSTSASKRSKTPSGTSRRS